MRASKLETVRDEVIALPKVQIRTWQELSEPFLDSDFSINEPRVIEWLATTPYGIEELRRMFIKEVMPAVYGNLWGIAGVWGGFDEEWLARVILIRRKAPKWQIAIGNRIALFCTPRSLVTRMEDVFKAVEASRRMESENRNDLLVDKIIP